MLIALYQDHHELPFCDGQTNPFDIFSLEKHGAFPMKGEEITEKRPGESFLTVTGYMPKKFAETEMFSFLCGLYNVKADHLMAHVSVLCDRELVKEGWWHYPKRIWVQISPIANEFTDEGIPVVYDMIGNRKPEINCFWGSDNGTYWPYSFFEKEELQKRAMKDSKIWTRFFVEQLDLDPELKKAKENFHAAEELLKEAKKEVDVIQVFGIDQLNQKINQSFNVC